MLGKIFVVFALIVGGFLAIRLLHRATSLSSERKKPFQETAEDLERCPRCGIYIQQTSGCIHCSAPKQE